MSQRKTHAAVKLLAIDSLRSGIGFHCLLMPSQLPEGPEAGDSDPDEFDRATFLGREKAGGLSCLKYQAQDPDTGTVTFWISEDYGITVRMKGQGISLETTSVKAGPIPDGVFSPR